MILLCILNLAQYIHQDVIEHVYNPQKEVDNMINGNENTMKCANWIQFPLNLNAKCTISLNPETFFCMDDSSNEIHQKCLGFI